MIDLFYKFLDWFREDREFGAQRSNDWPRVRKGFVKKNPICAVCWKKGSLFNSLNVHHIRVFHKFPELELDENNLIVLCRQDHFSWGHYYNFSSWNENIKEDVEKWRNRVLNRPK